MHRAVNRPHEGISFENVLKGLIDLRREFRGQYWLEIFLLAGHTAIDAEVAGLIKCVDLIKPDRVQLNTVARPPAESYAVGASHDRMLKLASMFSPPAEVISDAQAMFEQPEFSAGLEDVLEMLRRRPCSIDDIANGLGIHRAQAVKYVEELNLEKLIEQATSEGRLYYRIAL
jgi:wyosine [tRNA(Phe)-imidazoG37] synthetase (radical SAM superfamily)